MSETSSQRLQALQLLCRCDGGRALTYVPTEFHRPSCHYVQAVYEALQLATTAVRIMTPWYEAERQANPDMAEYQDFGTMDEFIEAL